MAAAKKCPAGKRYLACVFAVNSYNIYVPINNIGSSQSSFDCIDDARCAVERCVKQNNISALGYTAVIIDTQEKKLASVASSAIVPTLDWSDLAAEQG